MSRSMPGGQKRQGPHAHQAQVVRRPVALGTLLACQPNETTCQSGFTGLRQFPIALGAQRRWRDYRGGDGAEGREKSTPPACAVVRDVDSDKWIHGKSPVSTNSMTSREAEPSKPTRL